MLGELSKDRRRLAIKSSGETVFVWTISGIVLAACGGGGGGGGGLSFGPRVPTAPPVNVSDGPVSGARVYFDTDGDGEVSTAEMEEQGDGYPTGTDGQTDRLPSAYRGAAFVAIVDGAIDTDTGKTLSGSYQSIASPDGQHRIATPITDLIARAQREDETTEAVVARILTAAEMNPETADQQLKHILDPAYYDAGTNKHGEDLFIISLTNEVAKDKASGRPETDPIRLVTDAFSGGYLTPATISYANTDGMFAENFDTSNHLATLTHPIITITTAVIVGVVYTDKTTGREVTRTGASANDRAEIDRLFSIDLNGGSPQIFVGTGGLDFERADEYTLTVDLGDARDETIPALVKIIVTDVNEPTATIRVSFTEPTTSALMAGENNAGWILQLTATSDAGGGDTSPIDKYEFFDGSSTSPASGIFRIDENGRITIMRAFDYEADATSYRLTVRATDSRSPAKDGDITFTVTVLDANDIVPDLSATTTTATIAENVVGADAGDIRFTIDDDDTNNVFNSDSFTISAGTGTSPTTADKFEIVLNGANWDLKLRARDDANNPLSLDYETDGVSGTIRLNVKVNDGVADSNVVPITITLIDANEPPRFAQSRYDVPLPENTVTDGSYTIETPTATDRDGDTLIYSIKSGNDAGLFEINSASGAVRLVSAVDFEVAPNTYTLIIEARDRLADDASGLTDTTELVITVTNADDGSGVYELVSSNGFAKRSLLTVMETMPDPDGVSGSIRVEWYKTPKDGTRPTNPFQTTGLTGNYKLTADDVAVGNEVTISAVVKYRDRSDKDEVIDNADLSITTGNTVIRVEDAGGNTIPETTGFYALDLNENVDGTVLEITAMDPEVEASSTHSVLGVSLDQIATGLGFTLAHSGSNDNIYILSGPSHGLNYEARAANFIISKGEIPIPFTITASFDDPTDNSVRQIDIRINPRDVDDHDIEFTDDATHAELDYAPSITIDHTGIVTKVEATDDDATAVLSYSITSNDFVIDATSGVITVAAGVTLTARTYALTVTATDATSGDTKTQTVEVTVAEESDTVPPDDGDDAPSDDLVDAEIYESHPLSKVIGSITVPDGANFMLSDGFDNALFRLDTEGKLWWRATPDFESPMDSDGDNIYQINVTFTYTDGTPTSSQRYDLEVMDIGPGRYDYGSSKPDGGSRTYLHHRPDVPLPKEPGGLSNYILHGHAFVTPETGPLILTWALDPDSDYTAAQTRPITERAFAMYEAVANIKFIEVDWSASKDIEMLFNQASNTGSAYWRHRSNAQVDRIGISSPTIEDSETDYFQTVLHEIGHIIGLKHPFEEIDEGGWSWDAGHRRNPNTIMSYYDFPGDPNRGDELLPADIAALHFLYGPPEGTAGAEDWEPPHWLARSNNFRFPPLQGREPIFISETAAAGTKLYTITAENNFISRFPNPPTPARSEYELPNRQGDNKFFQLDSVTGVISLKQKLDYGNPLDKGEVDFYAGNNVYEVAINGRHSFDDEATQARLGNSTFSQYLPIVVLESIDLAEEGLTDINLVTRGAAKTPTDYVGKEVIGTDGVNRISDGHGYDIIRGNGNDDIITLTTTPKDENKVIYRIGNQVAIDGGDQVTGFERGKDELILALPENMTTSAITNFAGFVNHINGGTPTDLTDDWFGVKLVTDAGKTMLQGLSFHFEKIVVGAGSSSVMHIMFSTSVPLSEALGSATLASITDSDGYLTDFGLLDDLLGGEQSFKFITEEFTIPTNTMAVGEDVMALELDAVYEQHPVTKEITTFAIPSGFAGATLALSSDTLDNDLFTIRDGKLWWISTPDYESPADVDRDNVYEIEVTFTKTDDTTTRQRYDLEVQDIGPGRYGYDSSNLDGGARTYIHHRPDVPLHKEPGGLSNYILHGHAFITPETGPLILTWALDPDSDFTAAQMRPITERAFVAYEAVANFKFIEVDWSASKDIEMLFEQRQGESIIGYALWRHGSNAQVDKIGISFPTIEDSETDYFPTVIHEIGHIIGLKHPFEEIDEGGWSWDRGHLHNPNTIMSYYLFENDPNRGDELLPADIAALRFLYGPPEGTAGAEDWEPPHWLLRNHRFHVNPSPSSEPIFISETAAAGTELYTITVENNFLLRLPNLPTPARSEYELRNGSFDNEFFQFDSVTGVLSLKQKLDYGNPLDKGDFYAGNNVYEVAINGEHFFDDTATQARWGNQTFTQYVTIVVLESIDLATEGLTDINLVTRGAAKTPTDYVGKEVIGTDGVNRISDGHGHDIIRGNGNDDIITLTTTPKDENEVIYRIGNQVAIDGGDQVTGFERGKDELILALPENMTTSAITNFAGFVNHINGGTPTDLTDDWFGVKLVTDAGKTMLQGLSFHFEKIVVGAGSSSVMHIMFSTSFSTRFPLSDALGSPRPESITNSDGYLTDFGFLDDLLGGEQSFKFITEAFTIPTNTTYAPTLSVAYTTGTAGTIDESVDAGTAVTGITFTAGDVDGGSLTYHIIGGDGMHIFEILEANRTTGKITLKANATLDDETKPNYTLSVVVRDSDGAVSIPVEVNINVTEEPRTHPLKVRATNDAPNQITDFDRGKDKLTFMLEATDISESGSSLKNGDSISEFIKYVTNDSIGWKDDPLSIVLDYRFPHGQVELHGLSFYSRVGVDDGDSVLVGNLTFSEAISNHQEIINFHGDRQKILNTTNGNAILVDLDYLDDLLGGVDSFGFEIV